MDPSIFLQYSPPNGLPQESKLATYMVRRYSAGDSGPPPPPLTCSLFQNRSPAAPVRALTQALGKVSLESSPTSIKKVLMGEYMPINYFAPPNILPESPDSSPPSAMPGPSPSQVHQENVGGTTYFYATNADGLNTSGGPLGAAGMGGEACMGGGPSAVASPYATQMYQGTPTHMPPHQSKPGLAATFYMPETIRAEIYERNEDVFLHVDPHQYPDLPENVEMYSDLAPLEGAPAGCFRATHRQTGVLAALRRLPAPAPLAAARLDLWKQIDHPNVVRLLDFFTTNAFGDHSLVLVYEYHPACVTLLTKFLSGSGGAAPDERAAYHDPFSSDPDAPRPYTHQKNAMLRAVACGALLPEAELWSLLVQLTAALRCVHAAGLACRGLDPTKVVMSGCRVRVAWPGAADALRPGPGPGDAQAQQEDLAALGRLALALASRSPHCDNLPASMELVARTYSADLKNLILYLLSTSPARRSVTDLMPMIGARFYTQVEALQRRADAFEEQLARELDNGRLLRLLVKLGLINERPELNLDASWSETGDRYMLKLFRDYLFHGVGPDGAPWLDQAHLVHCLNQLDGGSAARVELVSRDEQSVLVVSYAELKHCLEQAFDELMSAAGAGASGS